MDSSKLYQFLGCLKFQVSYLITLQNGLHKPEKKYVCLQKKSFMSKTPQLKVIIILSGRVVNCSDGLPDCLVPWMVNMTSDDQLTCFQLSMFDTNNNLNFMILIIKPRSNCIIQI